jgi:hypothetical protein
MKDGLKRGGHLIFKSFLRKVSTRYGGPEVHVSKDRDLQTGGITKHKFGLVYLICFKMK